MQFYDYGYCSVGKKSACCLISRPAHPSSSPPPSLPQVELTCQAPYVFPTLNASITTTCLPDSLNWTFVDADSCLATLSNASASTCSPESSSDTYDNYSDDPYHLHCRIRELSHIVKKCVIKRKRGMLGRTISGFDSLIELLVI